MKPAQSSSPDRSGSKTEAFKVATGATVKAISGHGDATITYTPAASNQRTATTVGNEVRLPMPPQKLTPETVVRLRGAAELDREGAGFAGKVQSEIGIAENSPARRGK